MYQIQCNRRSVLSAGRIVCPSKLSDKDAVLVHISAGHEEERRTQILQQMLKSIDPESPPLIEPPFTCDYVSFT